MSTTRDEVIIDCELIQANILADPKPVRVQFKWPRPASITADITGRKGDYSNSNAS